MHLTDCWVPGPVGFHPSHLRVWRTLEVGISAADEHAKLVEVLGCLVVRKRMDKAIGIDFI